MESKYSLLGASTVEWEQVQLNGEQVELNGEGKYSLLGASTAEWQQLQLNGERVFIRWVESSYSHESLWEGEGNAAVSE